MASTQSVQRRDGRAWDEIRKTTITPSCQSFAEGSALIEMGLTRVLCAATIEERIPPFLRGTGKGWVTAEYSMLPRSTGVRTPREGVSGQVRGRTSEIQRLIGRSLRAVTDLEGLGERTVLLDCDVTQADGGTRTAAITGAYVALYEALLVLVKNRVLDNIPIKSPVAAVSTGIVDGRQLLDLCYEEDLRAGVDFNVVMTEQGDIVEIQGTAEGDPFPRERVEDLISLAAGGLSGLFQVQKEAIQAIGTY